MKLKSLLTYSFIAAMLSASSSASAAFDFGGPFDWFDNDDDYYRYGSNARNNRGYGRERWRQYDEWEPNYWRYRYFDDDSNDYIFDEFDGGDFFGDGNGRGRFNFDMNTNFDSDFDGNYDGRYDNRYRDYDRYSDNGRYRGDNRSRRNDRYNDDYWRNYSSNRGPRMSRTPEQQQRRSNQNRNKAVECR